MSRWVAKENVGTLLLASDMAVPISRLLTVAQENHLGYEWGAHLESLDLLNYFRNLNQIRGEAMHLTDSLAFFPQRSRFEGS